MRLALRVIVLGLLVVLAADVGLANVTTTTAFPAASYSYDRVAPNAQGPRTSVPVAFRRAATSSLKGHIRRSNAGFVYFVAAKAGDEAAAAAAKAARVPSTQWGKTIADFKNNPDEWRRISAHAEEATSKAYRGGLSIEEVFERGTARLVRHRIYGPRGDVLHQTFRPSAKFGAP